MHDKSGITKPEISPINKTVVNQQSRLSGGKHLENASKEPLQKRNNIPLVS